MKLELRYALHAACQCTHSHTYSTENAVHFLCMGSPEDDIFDMPKSCGIQMWRRDVLIAVAPSTSINESPIVNYFVLGASSAGRYLRGRGREREEVGGGSLLPTPIYVSIIA